MKGDIGGRIAPTSVETVSDLGSGKEQVEVDFPLQVNLGGHFDISPDTFTVLAEYGFTQYSIVKKLDFQGRANIKTSTPGVATALQVGGAAAIQPQLADQVYDFRDQHVARIGFEYKIDSDVTSRLGYAYTSQVTPKKYAKATASSPGAGQSVGVGLGYAIDKELGFDWAFEWSKVSGSVGAGEGAPAFKGDYESSTYGLHLGTTYLF
jgi:long-subunit fatty acid transport protein